MWLFGILLVLYKGIPWWLLIIGSIILLNGILTRHDTRNDIKPKGFSLIVTGLIVLLPSGIYFGNIIVGKVEQSNFHRNSVYYQLHHGSVKDLERLLKKGAVVEGIGYSKERAAEDGELTWLGDLACYGFSYPDSSEKAELLIEYSADVNRVMCFHNSNCPHDKGADDHKKLCSATPVLLACDSPDYDVLKVLIDNGGNVNAVDYYGYSALDIVELKIKDTEHYRPARIEVFKQMRDLLIESGAKKAVIDNDDNEDNGSKKRNKDRY